ncbi:MAG: DUF4783 domain-containing protein [Chitinophagaceae bacterium]|nr:DUF4783 domain-containing protein [Chitinophagaceae bacterium]HMN32504.1 DUF4783 domain-containing protein [Chitinophagaceae bacterium]
MFGIVFILLPSRGFAQEFLKKIEFALLKGNAKEMSPYFDKYVNVSILEKTNSYSKNQAELVIQNFFSKIEPKHIDDINKGFSQTNQALYYICTLKTSNSQFQIYLFFIIRNATYVMKEIRIEKL